MSHEPYPRAPLTTEQQELAARFYQRAIKLTRKALRRHEWPDGDSWAAEIVCITASKYDDTRGSFDAYLTHTLRRGLPRLRTQLRAIVRPPAHLREASASRYMQGLPQTEEDRCLWRAYYPCEFDDATAQTMMTDPEGASRLEYDDEITELRKCARTKREKEVLEILIENMDTDAPQIETARQMGRTRQRINQIVAIMRDRRKKCK